LIVCLVLKQHLKSKKSGAHFHAAACGISLYLLIYATNHFVSRFNPLVSSTCPFYNDTENVFHLFCECFRLVPLFVLLDGIMSKLGFLFNKTLFIFGNRYRRSWQRECKLANFLLGQAKLAILKSHQCKNENQNVDLVMLFKSLVKSRVVSY